MTMMIEKVARAICAQQEIDPDELTRERPEYEPYPQWWGFTPTARAAIEAMREPTEEMQTAALAKIGYEVDWVAGLMGSSYSAGVQVFADAYTAMIDGALSEDKPE
ncbi:hypothetical protein [Shinella sp. JR1-6]|uniref:hypothetical protein n=1 Tax=Shinella sp. JR1-6 TaxID=2527671 RepID=UPI00102D56BA|nr:hypothetical protein [Shinella sp. JR1-6]TAA49361.1 hypothetical protein EXZ48_34385 [Shinella sp. JR1-6]